MIHPDDTAKTFVYDALDRMIAETNELGQITKRAYDAYGNLVYLTDPAGGTTQYLYDESEAPSTTPRSPISNLVAAARRLTGIISPARRRTLFTNDSLGRRLAETVAHGSPEAATSRTEYDAVGNVVKTISPTDQVTTYAYDRRNRRIATTDALNRTWKFVHATSTGASGPASCCGGADSNAPALETHNPDSTVEVEIRDAAGQLVETKDALGHSVKHGYDPDGRLESLTDENGNLTRWTYDPRGTLRQDLRRRLLENATNTTPPENSSDALARMTPRSPTPTIPCSGLLSAVWDADKAPASHFAYDAAGRMHSGQKHQQHHRPRLRSARQVGPRNPNPCPCRRNGLRSRLRLRSRRQTRRPHLPRQNRSSTTPGTREVNWKRSSNRKPQPRTKHQEPRTQSPSTSDDPTGWSRSSVTATTSSPPRSTTPSAALSQSPTSRPTAPSRRRNQPLRRHEPPHRADSSRWYGGILLHHDRRAGDW